MILTSLNSPEEQVLSCGAPWDKRKLDHKYHVCMCDCVCVSVFEWQVCVGFQSSGTIVFFSVKRFDPVLLESESDWISPCATMMRLDALFYAG